MVMAIHVLAGVLMGLRFTIMIMLPASVIVIIETCFLISFDGLASGLLQGTSRFFILLMSFFTAAFVRWATTKDEDPSCAEDETRHALKVEEEIRRRRGWLPLI